MPDTKLTIETRSVGTIKPHSRNARRHSERQIQQIAASIREFGFTNPILIDGDGVIIAGHGRLQAAKALKITEVPVIRITHLSDAQRRALMIADNKLTLNAAWDMEMLKVELGELSDIAVDFDIELTGFNTGEIDALVFDDSPLSAPGSPTPTKLVTRPGDIWILGEHRIFCGDARDPQSFLKLMGVEKARLLFADPPYNVPIDGHATGLGRIKHKNFQMATGEMSSAEFSGFLRTIFTNASQHSRSGAIHFICMDWRHIHELLSLQGAVYPELLNVCIWNKDNAGMGSFYRSKHELVFVFKHGTGKHLNNIELGKNGRYRTNVWDYESATTDELKLHPTVKPLPLVIDAIKDCSKRGEIVLDPFGGSGTTLLAAERAKRKARLIEIDPAYVDVTVCRWQAATGLSAINEKTGKAYSEGDENAKA